MNAGNIDGNFHCEMDSGKKAAYFFFGKSGIITICCKTASAKKCGGRSFRSISDAINAYKSADMKAMIAEAARMSK